MEPGAEARRTVWIEPPTPPPGDAKRLFVSVLTVLALVCGGGGWFLHTCGGLRYIMYQVYMARRSLLGPSLMYRGYFLFISFSWRPGVVLLFFVTLFIVGEINSFSWGDSLLSSPRFFVT